MPRKWPISVRLALQFSLLAGAALLVFSLAVSLLFALKGIRNTDTLLFVQYQNIANGLRDALQKNERIDFQNETYDTIESVQKIGLFAIILDPQNRIIEHSTDLPFSPPRSAGYSTVRSYNGAYRFYVGKESNFTIITGQNLSPLERSTKALLVNLVVAFIIAFLLSLILSAIFAARAIRPLAALERKVRAFEPPNLPPHSLASEYAEDEIGRLAATFDEFLQKLDQAFRRERQFTQDASHELRTPLMVLKSSLELLRLQAPTLKDEQREKLDLMEDSLRSMERLIEELLFLSRGVVQSDRSAISLKKFLERFLPPYEALARKKGVALTLDLKKDITVETSDIALEKVIGNLLKNAIRFTDHGSIAVSLRDRTLMVKDTGPGIDPEHVHHIFERFYRADGARSGEGFGLGLAIAKAMCDREGWTLSVESEVGKGSAFHVRFG